VAPAIIKGTTNQFEMDPKSNALADALAQMAGPQGAAAAEPSAIASFFGFGGGAPVTNAPAPMPAATPAADSDGNSYAGDGGNECSGAGGGAGVVDAGGGAGCLPSGTNQ
jgi:hypothetical protein